MQGGKRCDALGLFVMKQTHDGEYRKVALYARRVPKRQDFHDRLVGV